MNPDNYSLDWKTPETADLKLYESGASRARRFTLGRSAAAWLQDAAEDHATLEVDLARRLIKRSGRMTMCPLELPIDDLRQIAGAFNATARRRREADAEAAADAADREPFWPRTVFTLRSGFTELRDPRIGGRTADGVPLWVEGTHPRDGYEARVPWNAIETWTRALEN